METQIRKIELHQLVLRYEHTRIYKKSTVNRLYRSIECHGQLTPVTVVPAGEGDDLFILLDGYLRYKAMRMCARDTIAANISDTDEMATLLHLLANSDANRWEAIEQASLFNELKVRFDMSIGDIAKRTGKDKSWVKRRIDLVTSLPENALDAVRSGDLSTWSASRVLVPLARANSEHADRLTAHLRENPLSTRELAAFHEHYQKAGRTVRSRMVDNPTLFMKAAGLKKEKRRGAELASGPEGKWLKDMKVIYHILIRLKERLPAVHYPNQEALSAKEIRDSLNESRTLFEYIHKEVTCRDRPRDQGCDKGNAWTEGSHIEDPKASRDIEKHRPQSDPGKMLGAKRTGVRLQRSSSGYREDLCAVQRQRDTCTGTP